MSQITTESNETKTSSWRDKTLKAAGVGYLVGDFAGVGASVLRGKFESNWATAGGFATWAAGGLAAAVYGNPDSEKQLEILAHKLEAYLVKHGATVTDAERNQSDLLRGKNGLGATLDRFMHEHPTEILNASYAVGASMLIRDGIKEVRKIGGKDIFPKALNKAAFGNVSSYFWFGSLVLAGALTGLLLKEDPDARAKVDPNSITSRVAGFFKEKPMRASGAFYWGGNLFAFKKAMDDRAAAAIAPYAIKPHHLSFLTVAAYVASNGLLALSSRDQVDEKKLNPEHLAQLEQVAAEIIAAQPPQVQAQLLTSVSEYLAKEKMVATAPEELSKQLIARVAATSKRHLAQGTEQRWAARTAAAPSAASTSIA